MNTGKQLEKLILLKEWVPGMLLTTKMTYDMNVINGIWAFKCKQFPNGAVKKFKAQCCAHEDQQLEGIDFFETYAPVIQLITVFLILILENLLCLKSNKLMLLWSSYVLILEKKRNSIRGASWFQATQFKWEVEDSFSQENSLWPTSKSLCLLEIPY